MIACPKLKGIIRATNFDDSMSSDESDMNGFNLSMIDKTIGTSVLQNIRK